MKKPPVVERGDAILRRLPEKARAAEIGVLDGRLSSYLLRMNPCHLVMVDSWLPADKQPESYRNSGDDNARRSLTEMEDIRQRCLAAVASYRDRCTIYRSESKWAAQLVPDQSLDLVFLDADHSHEGVISDIHSWLPKVKPGGYIGGHDYANPDYKFGVKSAVDLYFGTDEPLFKIELDENYTWFVRV